MLTPMENVFILGGTREQSKIFARYLAIDPKRIISDLRHLDGIPSPTVLLVGSWRRTSAFEDIMGRMSQNGATFLEVIDFLRPSR